MTVAETPKLLTTSVSQAVFKKGCAKDSDPVSLMAGVTWKRITWIVSVGSVPCHMIDRRVEL
jgi:hypothetical protein